MVLRYFNSYQDLFDLELFQSKISSGSSTISDGEQRIFSGLPFWEINEELLMGLKEDQSSLASIGEDGSFVNGLGHRN